MSNQELFSQEGAYLVPCAVDFRNQTVSDKFQTLTANSKGPSANNTPYVMATGQADAEILAGQIPALTCNHEQPIVFAPLAINENQRCELRLSKVMGPLNRGGGKPGQGLPIILAQSFHGSQDPNVSGNVTHPIGTNRGLEACIFQQRFVRNGRGGPDKIASALTANAGETGKWDSQQCVAISTMVRRITPIEAERLQGFPDNYTKIPGAKDGPRYKALGNSMAVPVMRWIGERILKTQQILNSQNL